MGGACSNFGSAVVVNSGEGQLYGVIAHELGHILGLRHDNEIPGTQCFVPGTNSNGIMSSSITFATSVDNSLSWSSCSINGINGFSKVCLTRSIHPEVFQNTPVPSFDKQCEMTFPPIGYPDFIRFCNWCYNSSDVCRITFCQNSAGTQARSSAFRWFTGTTCGSNQICYRGVCTDPNEAYLLRPVKTTFNTINLSVNNNPNVPFSPSGKQLHFLNLLTKYLN